MTDTITTQNLDTNYNTNSTQSINGGSNNVGTINSSTITPQPALGIPQAKPDTTPYTSIIDGAVTSLPSVTGQVADAQKKSADLLAGITATSTDTSNKEVYSQAQQDLQGVKDKQAQLDALNAQFNDIGAQIKGLSRASSSADLITENNNFGLGTTIAGTDYQTTDAKRLNAIKALTLASQADVLGAQITNQESRVQRAKDNAQLAVDLKFKPEEAKLQNMKDMLELNQKYVLDPAEAKRVEATNIALNERARLLAEAKQNEKDNTDLVINANSQGAPASLVATARQMMQAGKKPAEIAQALGVYAGDYIGNQAKLSTIRSNNLQYKINNYQFNQLQALPVANVDGVTVRGAGATPYDRNLNTIEQIVRAKGKQIPDTMQTQIALGTGVLNSIDQFAKANASGEFSGMYPLSGVVPSFAKSDARTKNEGLLNAVNLKVQQWASGASLTAEQTKQVAQMVPSAGDTDARAREKLNTLADMMAGQISADFSSAGVKYRPETASYFDNGISTKVRNAVGAGYSATDVVTGLSGDATYGSKIQQAKKAGWSDDQIVIYLQSIKEAPANSVDATATTYGATK